MLRARLFVILSIGFGFGLCLEFQNTTSVCTNMTLAPISPPPQVGPAPFSIHLDKKSYRSGESVKINVDSPENIIGFMIAAKHYEKSLNQRNCFGHFRTNDFQTNQICETDFGKALTHAPSSNAEAKRYINLVWDPSPSTQGHLVFKLSVVYSGDRYWVGEPSEVLLDESAPSLPSISDPTAPPSPDSIMVSQCGKSKGCYRNPPGCDPLDCDVLVTWNEVGDGVEFQLTGDTSGWVSVAFSEDTKPGRDEVFECMWNETSKQVEVKHMRSREDGRTTVLVSNPLSLTNKIGVRSNRRITCFFKKDKTQPSQNNQFMNDYRYLLLSKGRADNRGGKLIHEQEANKYPYVSPIAVKMSDKVDLSDTIRYPLVKAHGCLMVIGWMLCFMSALMLSKYYRPMWPNTRWCDSRVWYSAYMFLVALCVLFTVIAFILIFVHASGYVKLNIYPDKAHPPIGITTTILIILVFLLAFCRPTEPGKRSAFGVCINWFLWLFETAASVLATVNIFIGLNLPKAHVPWWTTWVVVVFFLFHLIVELTLEIHGCLNSKKEDFRRQEYEKQKKGSEEPDPVGTGFKNRTIAIYLFVTVVLCFIIVISIATG